MPTVPGSAEDWKRLGFHCGLEIHHQILTEKKLFCHCPAGRYSDTWHAEALRHMRPTLSELGEYDGTALMEFKTKKEIIYRLNRETVCTYEMDDTPPFPINQDAVDIALTIAQAFRCKIVGELHIIRKQYLDGSIPTGFQRTAIVGVDGELPLSTGRSVRIIQVGLEEDACREASDMGHRIIFYTDRLSMPLIEVVADHEMETPEEAAEAADRIGTLLRATGMVRRGIGAGRQDVNVSVKGSTRVEIKGVPRIPRIPALTGYEALRQEALLALRDEMRKRGFEPGDRPGEAFLLERLPESFHRPELEATRLLNDSVRLVKLPKATGLLRWPLGGGRTFADELAGRVRVIACLDASPNLLHTDGPEGHLDDEDRRTLREVAECENDDQVVIVWGPDVDTRTAAEEILDRWAEAIEGVPNETRQALRKNTTDFERVLPGPDRMYPDTDSPPYEITEERVRRTGELVPEYPWDRAARYRELGVSEDMARLLAIDPLGDLFDRLLEEKAVPPVRGAEVLTRFRTAARRAELPVDLLGEEHWSKLLRALGEGTIHREGVPMLIASWCSAPEKELSELLASQDWQHPEESILRSEVLETVEMARSTARKDIAVPEMAMGSLMARWAGRVAGRRVHALVMDAING